MAITIGSVNLNENLLLNGIFDSAQVSIKAERTLSGRRVIFPYPSPGRNLVLTTSGPNGRYYGFFTRDKLIELATIRDSGSITTLNYRGTEYSVIVESLNVTQISGTALIKDNDMFSGDINLLEIID